MDRERRLIATLIRLADTLVADHDTQEFLYVLSEQCVEMLHGSAAGVLLGPVSGQLGLVGATSERMRELETFQLQHQQGPCYDAYISGETVSEPDLARCADRWPEFVAQADDIGYRSVMAQPMAVRGNRVGAINIYRDMTGPFQQQDLNVARGMADMAAIGIVNERALAVADEQIAQLRFALDTRAVVEHAKALIAERLGVDQAAAFHRLRRYARDHNAKVRDVARRFVDGDLDESALPSDR